MYIFKKHIIHVYICWHQSDDAFLFFRNDSDCLQFCSYAHGYIKSMDMRDHYCAVKGFPVARDTRSAHVAA